MTDLIPKVPSNPILSYKDKYGDTIKISSTRSLKTFYEDFSESPNLTLKLDANFDELLTNVSISNSKKSSEEDIINLILLGILNPTQDIFNHVKMNKTLFAKKVIDEILSLVKQTSIEEVSEKFGMPWEAIFYMTQEPNLTVKKPSKKINYNKVKNIFRPSKCLAIVQEYLNNTVTKQQIFEMFEINENTFTIWLDLFKNPNDVPLEVSHISDKEKLKLVSCYLLGELSLNELKAGFNVTQSQINSWAIHFSQEQKVYQRERMISAEEKYDVIERYLKGEYSVTQFQNDYGVRGNLMYRWVKQVQKGKTLTNSSIFRTASDELEQAYNIFLDSYN